MNMSAYLDNNATTQLDPRVLEAMLPYLSGPYGNPSSVHRFGRLGRQAIDRAREQVAALVGGRASEVIFTGGGTEANNLAIKGVLGRRPGPVLIGATEHHAVLEPAEASAEYALLSVDIDGQIDSAALSEASLISVMWVNNETGVIQDIPALVAANAGRALMHSDAVQAAGKIPLNFAESGLDLMTVAAHKFHGPKGVGALCVNTAVDLEPLLHGGGQESGIRGGTENIAGIVGMGVAAELAQAELNEREAHTRMLRDGLEEKLLKNNKIIIFGDRSKRIPNTSMFAVSGWMGETLVMELDRRGLAVSAGSACQSGKGEPSHVLLAMGIDPEVAQGAIRVSFSKDNQASDVDALITALDALTA